MLKRVAMLISIGFFTLYAQPTHEVIDLAKSLNLYPGTKATIQWKRIFSDKTKRQRYKINSLSSEQQKALEAYLIQFAADSDQPIVPGL